ncbi:MAG: AI-2E family transporter [Moorea sp. SIO2B7]|nr:AI-2E family transporter [Moorena sp. SIO2B7]
MNFGKWIGFIALMLSIYILWQIRQVILLLFTAVILANALNLLVKKIQDWGEKLGQRWGLQKGLMKRGYAVLIAIILSFVLLVAFFWLIVPPFVTQFQELAKLVPQGIEKLIVWLNDLKALLSPIKEALPNLQQITEQLQPLINQLLDRGWIFVSSGLGMLLNLLLLLALTLMLLADPQSYRQGFVRLFPSFYRRRIDEILTLCDQALQGWLVGILFNMVMIAVFSFIGLLMLGIPLALSQAMLAGIFTFIPNIGPALSVIPPMAIALLETPWKSLAVLILYIVIQQVESNILTPLVMAQQISLFPAITLLAQVFFASFFGFLGLFLALPLTVVGQVWLKEVLIKDILDQWLPIKHKPQQPQLAAETVIESQLPLPETEPPSGTEED